MALLLSDYSIKISKESPTEIIAQFSTEHKGTRSFKRYENSNQLNPNYVIKP